MRLPATASATHTKGEAAPAEPAPEPDSGIPQASAVDTRLQPRRAIGATRPVYDALMATGERVTWQRFAAAFDPPMARRTAQRHLAAHSANGQQRPPAPGGTGAPVEH